MFKGDISKFKKTVQLFHIFPIFIFLLISPFNLFAEENTYILSTNDFTWICGADSQRYVKGSSDHVRILLVASSTGGFNWYAVSDISNETVQNYVHYTSNNTNSSTSTSSLNSVVTISGTNYYVYEGSGYGVGTSHEIPVNSYRTDIYSGNRKYLAVYYSYGDGAVGPGLTPTFGELKIGFKTDIAYSGGNQDAWRLNKDTIYFDRYDTLGNDLFGNLIELQAVPYSVYDQSKQNLLTKTVNDYVFDTVRVGSLGYWSPGQDYIDFTWEYITNRFSPTWWSTLDDNYSFVGWYLNEKWYRVGWAYRARLVDEDNNVLIDWQWIYNGTSIDTQDVVNIVDNNGLTPELVNSINNINNYNNTTNNNTYNNQVVNYYSSDQESDGSWIEALLEMIASTIGNLIDLIKGIFHDLLLGLFNLVQNLGVNLIEFFSDLFDSISDSFGNIDLELPYFDVPAVSENDWFKDLFTQFVNDTVSSGIGFIIFIPLVVILIGVLF